MSIAKKAVRFIGWLLLGTLLLFAVAWACGALHYDGTAKSLPELLAATALVNLAFVRPRSLKLGGVAALVLLVLGWWLTLTPSNHGDWQPDVAQLARAEINGDVVTVHNVRNCDYRTELDYTPRWETRTVRLSKITGIDIAVVYWGSPYMAHPILSFQFSDAPPLCFSIETRKKTGQSYSAIGGLYRQFSLIYIVADERDVLRLRTNYRQGETIYLYRMKISPEDARERFLEYLTSVNQLVYHPRWYNALTTNCTTAIRSQHAAEKRTPWDWRLLVNGKGDEFLFDAGLIATGGLPFPELKRRVLINPAANAANDAPDFSTRIRAGLPGF